MPRLMGYTIYSLMQRTLKTLWRIFSDGLENSKIFMEMISCEKDWPKFRTI